MKARISEQNRKKTRKNQGTKFAMLCSTKNYCQVRGDNKILISSCSRQKNGERERGRQAGKQTDRQKHRNTETDRQTDRQTETDRRSGKKNKRKEPGGWKKGRKDVTSQTGSKFIS